MAVGHQLTFGIPTGQPHPIPQPVTGVQQMFPGVGGYGPLALPSGQPAPLALPRGAIPMGAAPPNPAIPLGAGDAPTFGPLRPAPQMFNQPRPGPAPRPAPDLFGAGGDSARRAASDSARAANRAPRASRIRQNFNLNADMARQGDVGRVASETRGGPGRAPTVSPPGPKPPSNLGPRFQGVRGAPGAGGDIAENAAAAQARMAARENAAALRTAGRNLPALREPITDPRAGANLMRALTGQAPPPPGMSIAPRITPPTSIPFRQVGHPVSGSVGLNTAISLAGRAALDRAFQNVDMSDPKARVLRAVGQGAYLGAPAGPTFGLGAATAAGATQLHRELGNLGDEYGAPGVALGSVGQAGIESIPTIGPWIGAASDFADAAGFEDVINDTGNWISENVPGGNWFAGFAGIGDMGEQGPTDEQVAAQQAEAERMARMQDPDYMDTVLARMNITEDGRAEAMQQYEDSVNQMTAMNEVGQLPVLLTKDGDYATRNDDGTWVFQNDSGEEETVSEDSLFRLDDEQVRELATQEFYASLPNLAAMDAQRLQMQNRAATLQSILAQQSTPLERMYQETADLYSAAGQPALAANQMDQYLAQQQMMQALPMVQAVDQQQALQDQIAQIQLNNQINAALNPDEDTAPSEAEQVLES